VVRATARRAGADVAREEAVGAHVRDRVTGGVEHRRRGVGLRAADVEVDLDLARAGVAHATGAYPHALL
jgi:hypothetical protein